jgi:pimeloyl-ACP methyl ester carboxylesterase
MERITTPDGTTVSYDKYGSGPPLVLIHGSFSDHVTNWQACKSLLADRFTVYAMARRGRGESSVTTDHTLEDEMNDTVAMLRNVGAPAFPARSLLRRGLLARGRHARAGNGRQACSL